jgi:hypothetical protein
MQHEINPDCCMQVTSANHLKPVRLQFDLLVFTAFGGDKDVAFGQQLEEILPIPILPVASLGAFQ